jgi:hypothetical protein
LDRAGKPFFSQGQGNCVEGAPGGSAVFDPEAQTRRELAEVRAPDRPASELRNADCGMRIAKENQKNPKSAIRNPK